MGWVADTYGHRAFLLLLHVICSLITGYIFLLYPDCSPDAPCHWPVFIGLTFLAFSASLMVLFWSFIYLIIEQKYQGTAYGLIFCIENCGLVLFPIIFGMIHDYLDGYFWVIGFQQASLVVSLSSAIGLLYYDKMFGYPLKLVAPP